MFKGFIKRLFTASLLMTSIAQADTVLTDVQGQQTLFSTLKGKWVLINYWAQWCQTCIDEIPELNRFYQNHKKDGSLALFAVNFDALPLLEQQTLIHEFKINYPNLLKDPARELHLGAIQGVPVTFVFNPQGKLVNTLYGGQTAHSLEQALK